MPRDIVRVGDDPSSFPSAFLNWAPPKTEPEATFPLVVTMARMPSVEHCNDVPETLFTEIEIGALVVVVRSMAPNMVAVRVGEDDPPDADVVNVSV